MFDTDLRGVLFFPNNILPMPTADKQNIPSEISLLFIYYILFVIVRVCIIMISTV